MKKMNSPARTRTTSEHVMPFPAVSLALFLSFCFPPLFVCRDRQVKQMQAKLDAQERVMKRKNEEASLLQKRMKERKKRERRQWQ